MKQYAVKVTDEALEDMRALRDYIENELLSPGNAERQHFRKNMRLWILNPNAQGDCIGRFSIIIPFSM